MNLCIQMNLLCFQRIEQKLSFLSTRKILLLRQRLFFEHFQLHKIRYQRPQRLNKHLVCIP